MEAYYQDENFTKIAAAELAKEYDNCTFTDCDLAEADLSGITFMDCEFTNCNLSNAKLKDTGMKTVRFRNCKLMGMMFMDCSSFLFSVDFTDCVLNFSSFYNLTLKKTNFTNCNLQETDLTDADLTEVVMDNCNLAGAKFEHTTLVKADLRTAYNYIIDPELNRVKGAKFSLQGIPGLLEKYQIQVSG